jgi:3-hydroxyisobutyrate dehydrogenase-like beta-hydroxyacid dehydrogenase
MDRPSLGFIGLGVMGEPMAAHLALAGYRLTIHDISRSRAESVASRLRGPCQIAPTPRATAERSDIVITMLPSGKYVRDVALGDGGLIHGFQKGALLLDTSSSEPWLTLQTAAALAEKGIGMVDAAVSGARAGAERAELVFMVGGDDQGVARVRPVLAVMGRSLFHLGPLGAGHAMKSINNMITAMTLLATAEGLVVGKQFGLDPDVMTDVLNASTGMSWISQTHIKQRITNRAFDDPFKLALMVKDIGIALELGRLRNLPLPFSGLGHHLWKAAEQAAASEASISEVVRWVETLTKTEIVSGAGRPDIGGDAGR